MNKRYLSSIELLNIATQHAVAADCILQQFAQGLISYQQSFAAFSPITSLMYHAFQLTLKAYCLHEHRPIKEYKTLLELIHVTQHLGWSNQEIIVLKMLTQQQLFHKGSSYDLWENPQQLHVFCEQIISLYARLLTMMPLELHRDYLV